MKKLYKPLFLAAMVLVVLLASCASTEEIVSDEADALPALTESETEVELPFEVSFAERLQALLRAGKMQEAIALFDELPAEYADDFDMQFLLASLLVSANRLEEASLQTDKLMELAPENQDVLMLSMMLAKASGNTAKKSATIKQILAADPNHPEANVELAQEQMLRRNYKLAKTYYERGLKGDPENVDALSGYGQVLYYGGNDKGSKAAFERVLKNDPDNSFAYSYLGKLAAEQENYKVATDNVSKALELDPTVFDYWMDYGQYLRYQGKFAEAEEAWITAKNLEPDYFLGYAYLAGLYDEQNRFSEALEMYRKVIELNPKYYFAYESLGMFAWHEGDYTESRAAFEKAYEANQKNVSYPLLIAATYLKEGKSAEAKNFLSKVIRNRDTSTVEYAMLRLYYDHINDRQVVQKVMNTSDRNLRGKMLYYLGLFYELNGNDVLSEKYYTDVLSLNSPMFFEFRMAEWAVAGKKK